jgi:hypothetical protein
MLIGLITTRVKLDAIGKVEDGIVTSSPHIPCWTSTTVCCAR